MARPLPCQGEAPLATEAVHWIDAIFAVERLLLEELQQYLAFFVRQL